MSVAVTPTSITANSTRRVNVELRWRTLAGLLALVASCVMAVVAPQAHGEETTPCFIGRDPSGEGFSIPSLGLWLAGDITVVGGVPRGQPAFLELDDVDVLARWEPAARVSFFVDVRLEETLTLLEGMGVERGPADLSIERLYAEILVTPRVTLRLGKFFTPFGLWNVIRRTPLTWTVDAPEVTEETFPRRATGLSLVYQTTWHGWSFDATGYGPAQDALPLRATDESGLMGGGRTAVGHELGEAYGSLGFSVAGYQDDPTNRWAEAYGTDAEITFRGAQIMGELEYTHLRGPDVSREYGGYLQGAIPIPFTSSLYGVLRAEYLQQRRGPGGVGGLVGLFWRPVPYLIIKTNYQFGDRRDDTLEPGFFTSVSLFF